MTAPTRRGCGRRAATLTLLPLALLALLPLALLAPPATAQSAPPADSPVQVVVTGLPRAPGPPSAPFVVTGQLVNRSGLAVHDLQVHLGVGDVLRSRSALSAAAATPPRGRARGPEVGPAQPDLAAGASTRFELTTTVGALGLGRLGVYPLQVGVRGRLGDNRRVVDLGAASTFVPEFPDGAPAPSRLAFLWPLVDAPARAPDGALLDTAVEDELRPGRDGASPGRLTGLLATARAGSAGACDASSSPPPPGTGCRHDPVPVTLAADPALLETVAALAAPHAVVDQGGRRGAAPASADAQQWLAGLREVLGGGRGRAPGASSGPVALLALPYGDPDVVALARQRSGLADDLDQLRLLGRRTAADLAGVPPLDGVAWPPSGRLTSAALDASLAGGATAVVLDQSALATAGTATARTAGTRAQLSSASAGRVTGLVVDDVLSGLLAAAPSDPDWQGARLAEQRWVAETAMVAAERPGESRTFLVAPARRGTVVPEVATEVLHDAGRLPWLCAVALTDVVGGAERCPATVADAAPADPPVRADLATADRSPAREELSAPYLAQVAAVRARGTQLTDEVLVAGSDAAAELKARFLRARARAVSSAWRNDPAGGRRLSTLYAQDVDSFRNRVRLTTSGRQLLTSDSGVIDVSISNALDQPITVGVQLNDPIEARLTSTDTGVRTIAPSEVVPVRVRVQTRTSGQFVVRATLLDRSGQRFGEPAELVVRSTGYGRLALAITGVGAGVLLIAAGVRIVRRALRRTAPVGPPEAP